jgi:hypothetical protein
LQDVMVVGEPTLMGGEFGDEDERLITRLENQQYEPTGPDDDQALQNSPALQHSPWGPDKKPPPGGHGPPVTSAGGPTPDAEIKTE